MLIRTDPRQAPARVPLDPARPARRHPRLRDGQDQRRVRRSAARARAETVKSLTGLDVNHVAFVDFDRFRELIDSVGGVDVDVPRPILANRFDCPYATDARCAAWDGWRFAKGRQHMDGRRALVYSRIRENRLDPSETDLDRARRQQQVIQATADKVTSFGTALRLPFSGGTSSKPLATDLSAGQVLQLGWAYFRADTSKALHCRLGGEPGSADGAVGDLRLGGQRRHDRDVHGPVSAARAAEGASLRAGVRDRRPEAVSGGSVRGSGLLVARAGVLRGLLLVAASLFSPEPPPSPSLRALAGSTAVVGRVEARALVMHRHRKQHLLDRARPADLAALGRRIAHLLEELEGVPVRATVLVDRHRTANLPAKMRPEAR